MKLRMNDMSYSPITFRAMHPPPTLYIVYSYVFHSFRRIETKGWNFLLLACGIITKENSQVVGKVNTSAVVRLHMALTRSHASRVNFATNRTPTHLTFSVHMTTLC